MSSPVTLVTGAASGIGAAVAERLSREGHRLALLDLDSDRLASIVRRIGGDRALALTADISSESDVADAFERAVAAFGRVDNLHSNAGILGGVGPLHDAAVDTFDRTMRVNTRGPFLMLREYVRSALRLGHGGSVVHTASAAGLKGSAGLTAYTMSKHAVVGLTRATAIELAEHGIRVNAVCPGRVDTPMVSALSALGDQDTEVAARPIGRKGSPAEVANLVVWLLSDEASYVTGAAYAIDGGYSA